jgi:transcriptional regulator GlxA family with amidase domain
MRLEDVKNEHIAAHPDAPGADRRRQIAILLFDGVEELDAVGPWEVLATWTQQHPDDGWDAFFLSRDGRPVRAAKTLVMGAHHSFDDTPALDVLLHPGGPGTRPMLHDQAHLDWVRQQRTTVPLMTSVCSGSLVYAAAGLLVGRRATTHWASLNALAELDPTIVPDVRSRYVDDGDLITSAGVSAGIDMSLHLVARLVHVERARELRREIQYDPQSPV